MTSKSSRYHKYSDELIGVGAFKAVYKAFDTETGCEVAWNQIRLDSLQPTMSAKIFQELDLLKRVEHLNIINFYDQWIDEDTSSLVFITEYMSSGTLRKYVKRVRTVRPRVIKKWCLQILEGLAYLHSHTPKIIHRDLKCDNIFINGNRGQVKIGDLGLSASLELRDRAASMSGTPEFMAPEIYSQHGYDEKVDIYAFGMCVLEMVTLEFPYSECANPIEIYKRVIADVLPEALDTITDPDTHAFISKCICRDPAKRPSSMELLEDPFLVVGPEGSESVASKLASPSEEFNVNVEIPMPPPRAAGISSVAPETISPAEHPNSHCAPFSSASMISDASATLCTSPDSSSTTCVVAELIKRVGDIMQLSIICRSADGHEHKYRFPFHLERESPDMLADHLVDVLERVPPSLKQQLSDSISQLVEKQKTPAIALPSVAPPAPGPPALEPIREDPSAPAQLASSPPSPEDGEDEDPQEKALIARQKTEADRLATRHRAERAKLKRQLGKELDTIPPVALPPPHTHPTRSLPPLIDPSILLDLSPAQSGSVPAVPPPMDFPVTARHLTRTPVDAVSVPSLTDLPMSPDGGCDLDNLLEQQLQQLMSEPHHSRRDI
eukprot:gnl/Dysnectes_brevis/4060_a5319_639.p1 GENE.gnl/Dysnectes_brevis/4060_a5319_639~~gnl/Dysnectes_brevis/4060_a5319_639.p1  ORF type:complete len:610 (+),score=213.61 gnl/Dysnectes_brevis/4060_a5319_639:86-1915(+)